MKLSKVLIFIILSIHYFPIHVQSQDIVHWPENDHYYMAFSLEIDFHRANEFSKNIYYLPGYLATITSEQELDFIKNNVVFDDYLYMLGGQKSEQDNQWEWITGEDWSFEKWCPDKINTISDAIIVLRECGFGAKEISDELPFIVEWDQDPTLPYHKINSSE